MPGRSAHPVDAGAAELLQVEAGERRQHAARARRMRPVRGALERVFPASPPAFPSSPRAVVEHEAAAVLVLRPVVVVVVVVAVAVVVVVVVVVVAAEVGGARPGARQKDLSVLLRRGRHRRRRGRAGPAAGEEDLSVLVRHPHLVSAVSCFATAVRRLRRFE